MRSHNSKLIKPYNACILNDVGVDSNNSNNNINHLLCDSGVAAQKNETKYSAHTDKSS